MIVAPLALIGLALFLRLSSVGVAIRASADSADRASLLGVPVKRLQTFVWAVASLLAFTAIFLRAGILGLPVFGALTVGVLLRALAALVLGRMTNLLAIGANAVALGVLEVVDRLRCVEPAADRPDPRPGHHRRRSCSRGAGSTPRRRGRVVDVAERGRRAPDPGRGGPHPRGAAREVGARSPSSVRPC